MLCARQVERDGKYCVHHHSAPSQGETAVPLTFILLGLLAGVLSGLFGIGGGVVIVPALILIGGFAPAAATGTSLAALLLPVGALGAWEYYKKGNLNIPAALWIALGLFFGAWVGAKLAQQLSPVQLRRAFAVFLVLVAGKVWWG
ncbi:MAG: sulfite exporter TauE/SafE family protein [Gemmatimonadales bacterium]